MKKLPLRIVIPTAAAVLVSVFILGLIWWQLEQESSRARLRLQGQLLGTPETAFTNDEQTLRTGDEVLLRLRQGDLAALQGDWGEAEQEYQASVSAGGGIPALRKLAQAQLQRRNIDAVRQTIDRLERDGARDEDLLLLKAIVFLRTGELVQAQTLLNDAIDSPQKHYGLALLAIVQGDHVAAQNEIQQVLAGWDPALRAYGRTLQTAYDEYNQFPNSPQSHLTTLLGRTLAQVQECELALPLLAQVLREHDDYRDAWIVQGYCELTTERTKEALASFERAYSIDPEKPEIQYFLGRTYLALKEFKNAIVYLEYAIENGFSPASEARRRLAQAAAESGDSAGAVDHYVALMNEPDATLGTAEKLITLTLSLDRTDDAYALAQQIVQRWPDDAKAYELLGWAADEAGKTDEARTALQKALEIDPDSRNVKERLGRL